MRLREREREGEPQGEARSISVHLKPGAWLRKPETVNSMQQIHDLRSFTVYGNIGALRFWDLGRWGFRFCRVADPTERISISVLLQE